jgi:SET domain-containing protein
MIALGESQGKGRGVFAQKKIHRGEIIEEAPVVVMPATEIEHLDKTVLQDYYFLWGENEDEAAVMLGLCSLCNHSYQPNAVFNLHPEKLTIEFVALREIEAGEEITTNYNGDPNCEAPIWFETL